MVSVIIPTYNREATIVQSVQSVLNQTYRDLECIVVDDGSIDNTKKLIDDINDPRVRYECLEKNSGACVARNLGIDLAQGEYIAFQDSDDKWYPQKIEIQIKKIIDSGADVCFCKKRKWNKTIGSCQISPSGIEEGFVSQRIIYRGVLSTQVLFAKSEVLKEIHFDENVKKSQDYEWGIRACEHYSFYFTAEILVDQFLQEDSITVNGWNNLQTDREMYKYFIQKFSDRFPENPDLQIALLRRKIRIDALSGENPVNECQTLYKLSKSRKDFVKYIASRIRLLSWLYRWNWNNGNR